jgi:phosphonopyruvate decarboxylase
MINPESFVQTLKSVGIDFFTGVPDSLLKNFCAFVTDTCGEDHVIAANEGGAVALASGHYLATGRPALVYMQNSGQGNTVNPLASLADPDVYSIPMVLLVGWRGEPGVKDEPQHAKQGKVTLSLFETLGIPTVVLPFDEPEALDAVRAQVARAASESCPVALVVRKGLFADYALQKKEDDISDLKREAAIEGILRALPKDAVVVSTTGMISREVYETRERLGQGHERDFLTVGSMGHAIMIALGIAKAQPKRKVVCLDGDGASIMHLGNMAIAGQSKCGNLTHIVLNNSAHDSVGGQPTVGGRIGLSAIAAACGYDVPFPTGQENPLPLCVSARKNNADKPSFVEIKVAKGARKDLGRPKEPPQVNKALFMETLAK